MKSKRKSRTAVDCSVTAKFVTVRCT